MENHHDALINWGGSQNGGGVTVSLFLCEKVPHFSHFSCRSSSLHRPEILQSGPGSVTVWGWKGSIGSDFRFRRFLYKRGFSVFQYIFEGKDGSGSGFGSWKTVPAVPVLLLVSGQNGSDGSGFRFRFGSWATVKIFSQKEDKSGRFLKNRKIPNHPAAKRGLQKGIGKKVSKNIKKWLQNGCKKLTGRAKKWPTSFCVPPFCVPPFAARFPKGQILWFLLQPRQGPESPFRGIEGFRVQKNPPFPFALTSLEKGGFSQKSPAPQNPVFQERRIRARVWRRGDPKTNRDAPFWSRPVYGPWKSERRKTWGITRAGFSKQFILWILWFFCGFLEILE